MITNEPTVLISTDIVTNELCPSVMARQKFDAKKGRTTSQAAIDFIRRTCPCLNLSAAENEMIANIRKNWLLPFGPIGLAHLEQRNIEAGNGGRTLFMPERIENTGDDEIELNYLLVGNKLQAPPDGLKYPFTIPSNDLAWKLDSLPGALQISVGVTTKSKNAKTFAMIIRGTLVSEP